MSMICACTHDAAIHFNGRACCHHRCGCERFSMTPESGMIQREIADSLAKLLQEQREEIARLRNWLAYIGGTCCDYETAAQEALKGEPAPDLPTRIA